MPTSPTRGRRNPKLEMARLFLVIAIAAAGGSVALYTYYDNLPAALVVGTSIVSSLLLLAASPWLKPDRINILLLYFSGSLALNAVPFTIGGLSSFGTCWLLGPPAVAFLLASRIHAFINLGISTLTLATVSYLHTQGHDLNYFPFSSESLTYQLVDAYHLFSLMLTVFFVDYVFATKERHIRNIALQAKNEAEHQRARIHALMDSLDEAILSVSSGSSLTLDTTYSKNSHAILDQEQLAGRPVTEVLQASLGIAADEGAQIKSVLQLALEGSPLDFELNAGLLPTKVSMTRQGQTRHYLLDWVPLTEADKIASVLICIKDVSRSVTLEQTNLEQENRLRLLGQILKVGLRQFKEFSSSCRAYLDDARQLLTASPLTTEHLNSLFRCLHTIKGNARSIELAALVDHAHTSEQSLQTMTTGKSAVDVQKLSAALDQMQADLALYDSVALWLGQSNDVMEEDDFASEFDRHCQGFEQLPLAERSALLTRLYTSRHFVSMKQALARSLGALAGLCAEVGKPLPEVKFTDEGVYFHRHIKATLEDIGIHLLTNAIDHGLEAPSERQRQGKNEAGTIELISSLLPGAGGVEIRLRDDGRGLNLAALRARLPDASQSNISDEALAATVFASGVSTAETLTTRSGRGVGMDAVKHLVAKLGGSIHIAFTGDSKVPGFRPFEWVVTLPATLAHRPAKLLPRP